MIWWNIAFIIFVIGLVIILLGGITDELGGGILITGFFWIISYFILIVIWAIFTVADFFGIGGWLFVAFLIVLMIIIGIIRR